MAKTITIAAAALLTGAVALPAMGAGRISVPGTDAAATSTIEVLAWSWGVTKAGSTGSPRRTAGTDAAASAPQPGPTISGSAEMTAREAGSGLATGRRQHQPVVVHATGGDCDDDDCDSATAPEGAFATVARRAAVDRFTVSVANLPATLARVCAAPDAPQTLSLDMDGDAYDLSITRVQGCPASARRGDMPNRISMNVSRQAAPACTDDACTADAVQLTFTGSMKHTKTGHVTLMK